MKNHFATYARPFALLMACCAAVLLPAQSQSPTEKALAKIKAAEREATLDLRNMGLTELPPEIGQLTQLEMLNLLDNQLSSLPASIGQLTQLKTLKLSGNPISSLPPEIGQLSQLSHLYLRGSQLSSLPPELQARVDKGELLVIGFTPSAPAQAESQQAEADTLSAEADAPRTRTAPASASAAPAAVAGQGPFGETEAPSDENKSSETVFRHAEEMPRFPGCEDLPYEERQKCSDQKKLAFIYKNVKYPPIAKAQGVQGTAVIMFVIETDGTVTNAQVVQSLEADCDAEALRVINSMNEANLRWIPAKQDGQPVPVQMYLPIRFRAE